ncbi:uncharacterized protein FIBRA_00483 [Fibroporia radiculosa]|uniref:AB hydrolase-1 domain-containing protein n=1 Tax=Fibroporia radiculosa TaxID=599839 RepID=J4GHV8_9APHY|nr:uncharacterized protein FIBRA_00483 [Fibroporia radiculosa]CCL98485.1 predicted protein [Fibroporia radiculosa]
MSTPTREGLAPFSVQSVGKSYETYYKVYGDLKSGVTPVIVIHGGPGNTHEYLAPLVDLTQVYGRPIVFYDQLGNGGSTFLRAKSGDNFWEPQLFVEEFHNLVTFLGIEEYSIVGHSWGAILGLEIAVKQPKGLRRLVLSSGLVSMELWEQSTAKLLRMMPEDIQKTIRDNESAGTFDSPDYQKANLEFTLRFGIRMNPLPDEAGALFRAFEKNPTIYYTMQGPSEFTITGSLRSWNIISELHKINVPTLLTNGAYDTAQDLVMAPAFEKISKVKWYTFSRSAHMAFVEEREKYMKVVAEFLAYEQ